MSQCFETVVNVDDLGEKPTVCQICKVNLATIKFKELYLCKWCFEDFKIIGCD
jgi:uncharacterized CHY-type Zn-finger protein